MVRLHTVVLVAITSRLGGCLPSGYSYPKPNIEFVLPITPTPESPVRNSDHLQKLIADTDLKDNVEHSTPLSNIKSGANELFEKNSYISSFNIQDNILNSETELSANVPETLLKPNPNFKNTIYPSEEQDIGFFAEQNYQNENKVILPEPFRVQNGFNQVGSVPVTKHIYFHVPPPDVEEYLIPTPPQPKKSYKILFIKLPSQDVTNNPLQLGINSNLSEQKTLIYVLVESPEYQDIVPASPKPSEHEVVFVKYKGNPSLNAEEVDRIVEIPRRKHSD